MKLLISGIMGKMGQVVYKLASADSDIDLIIGVDITDGALPCPIFKSFENITVKPDVVIDFSSPKALDSILNYATKNKIGVVLATTGYTDEDMEKIKSASKIIPVFKTGNLSIGINLLINLCKKASEFLGGDFDIEIIEKHHKEKVDAPSGTALMIANAIKETNDDKEYIYGRSGRDCKRKKNEIGIHAVRGGTIVGEHDVIFTANDETITLSHQAQSKMVFANGSIKAAKFLIDKPAGLYDMQDLLK